MGQAQVSQASDSLQADSLSAQTGVIAQIPDSLTASPPNDSSSLLVDSLSLPLADSEIKDEVKYKAEDSIVYDLDARKMYLYSGAKMDYTTIGLESGFVEFDWNTYIMSARGNPDSTGTIVENPIFTEGGKEYRAERMIYNFKTKKGKVFQVITEEGDAFLHSEAVKRTDDSSWYGFKAKYTTCNLEHPHFYFRAKKLKVVPEKVMVTGPANLVVGDIPTPLFIPFGLFPAKQGRRSGIIPPKPGSDIQNGFFLREGGYFWAVNDYLSLKLTGDVFTNGTFGINTAAQYNLRYKFSGSLGMTYYRTRPSDPDLPGARARNAFSIRWTHSQSPKARPNSSFSANVNAQTSTFYTDSRVTDARLLQTQFQSAVSWSRVLPGTPLSFNINFNHSQNLLSRNLNIQFPVFRMNVTRYAPFKAKVNTGKPRWFENIGFTYALEAKALVNTFDSLFLKPQTLNAIRYGINQNLNLDAPLVLFKYLNINPSFNYQERWYFQRVNKVWNPDTLFIPSPDGSIDTIYGRLATDTSFAFGGLRNFGASLSLSTKAVGIFNFKGKYLKGIRHIFTPSVSANWNPDFSSERWGYYRTVQTNAAGATQRYSPWELGNQVYGLPGGGRVGALRFNLANNFDMKVFSAKDTVNQERKVGFIDRLNFSGGYNFAADSLRLEPFSLLATSRISDNINFAFNAVFDPYATDSLNRKINRFYWQTNRKLLRLSSAGFALNAVFQSKAKAPNTAAQTKGVQYMSDYVSYDPNDYYDFNIPWTFSFNYNLNIQRGTSFNPDTILIVQGMRFTGDFNLTPKWKLAFDSGFDFVTKRPSLTNVRVIRDLHCWELNFNWTAYPLTSQQFMIELKIKSPVLQDLKLTRRRSLLQNTF